MLRRRSLGIALGLFLAAAAACGGWARWRTSHDVEKARERGAALFTGREAIEARLARHELTLPVEATRCSNCHGSQGDATRALEPAGLTELAVNNLPGRLDGLSLTSPRPRRAGPPSRFSASSLCRLLRTGIDPAHVLVNPMMPRYSVTDAQCEALWAFLIVQ